jgi:acetyl-CoA synthetase
MDSEDLLYLLYTIGTTAKPKGIVHTTAGYLVGVASTHHYIFDVKPDSVYWCAADVGWVTGHSYIVYGPLCNGTTGVMYEGVPDYPDRDRWWAIVERYGVDILYTAPTAIRSHMKWGAEHAQKHDLSSIRLLGSVGEPINPEAWMWYRELIGHDRCPIVDTWWQTETGMIMISPLPGATPTKPGSATRPLPGIAADVVHKDGTPCKPNEGGFLVIKKPWPSMLRTIYGDHERFKTTYFGEVQGCYFAGDGARKDEDGYIWVMGRVDDVINVAGHRLSTMEVESALVSHPKVAEAAVVGRPDDLKGQAIVAFVTPRQGFVADEPLAKELREHVAGQIGALARPEEIRFAEALPKTRSGKIMRRLLREVASGSTARGDTTTLEDQAVLERLATSYASED